MKEMDKTYSNGEMVDMLLANTKREAVILGEIDCNTVIIDEHSNLVWKHNGVKLDLKPFYKDRKWMIKEPPKKLKEMSFGEAFKYYRKNYNNKYYSIIPITSVLTNKTFLDLNSATIDEIDGLWTVEGEYEDD